jgi:predicted pyridoxine 5'-phosphate oxidase superfamily flavin-nucleotide-binding protein
MQICGMQTIQQIMTREQIGFEIDRVAHEWGKAASQNRLSQQVREEIIRAAIRISKSPQADSDPRVQTIMDVESTYIQCSKLLAGLTKAKQGGEISNEEYLSFEIQLRDQLSRLLTISRQLSLS